MSEDATNSREETSDRGSPRVSPGRVDSVGFDERTVEILSWVLDTETRARIYVYLRQHPWSTSEEVARGTGLYPSTVREALAEFADEGKVTRRKRQSEGAGNNPYEYTAIAPRDLVCEVVEQLQDELNALCNLDLRLGGERRTAEHEPVQIEVETGNWNADASETDDSSDPDADPSNPKR